MITQTDLGVDLGATVAQWPRKKMEGCLMLRHRFTVVALGAIVLMLAYAGPARATMILVDDFNDGNDDGWTPHDLSIGDPWGPGTFDASTGSYQFVGRSAVPVGEAGSLGSFWDTSSEPSFSNGLLRATMRANNDTTITAIVMRATPGPNPAAHRWYLFGGNPASGGFWYNEWDGQHLGQDGFFADELFLPGDDWMIEAGAVGNQLSMKVWKVGEQEPADPQWTSTDVSPLGLGQIGVAAWHWPLEQTPAGIVDATFDDIYFTFPEPLLGDLNLDGEVDGLDVNPFVDVLLSGPYQVEADMNEDQVVNGLDVDPFVATVVGGVQAIPEPTTLLLCLLALGLVSGRRKWCG